MNGYIAQPPSIRMLDSGAEDIPPRMTFSVEEAAEILGISRTAAYDAARRGELPHVRIGRRVLVPRRALLQLLGYEHAEAI